MTYNMFGGTLNLAQSINQSINQTSLWPLPLTADLENLFSNGQSHDDHLCQVLLK